MEAESLDTVATLMSAPIEGMEFVGFYLPGVRTVFASPTRGYEDRFIPVYRRKPPCKHEIWAKAADYYVDGQVVIPKKLCGVCGEAF